MADTKQTVTITTTVSMSPERAWMYWTTPEHITQWNFAHESWQCPHAEGDLRAGGKFSHRMEARDGSMGFDFSGTYDVVTPHRHLGITLDDGRKMSVDFQAVEGGTKVTETFEAEDQNAVDMQRQGWQAILDNYAAHANGQEGK